MVDKRNIISRVNDPDLLPDDDKTAEIVLMMFDKDKDKFRPITDKIQVAWMRKDGTITGCPSPMGLVMFDRYPGGSATVEQAIDRVKVLSVEKTERFLAHRCIPKDRRKSPVFTLQRIYKVVCEEK